MSRRLQSEAARQRELYKYWQPNETVFPSAEYDETFNRDYQPRPSYDSALTAYAQLGALRCNAKRGMISVVDQSYQYIIAEGTKTLALQDGSVTDQEDQLWFGLRTIPRSVGICATALGQFTEVEFRDEAITETLFEPLQFVIPDLSKDARFQQQTFVGGTPYLRFYAGVPIRSPGGHIIGIYSIVDDKPRYDFGERDLDILKDLAATVMDHLVLGTVRGRHHRADRMVKGLGLFVEGKATLRDWWLRSGHLAQGPTTADGNRGDWTLKARADAEFGPQVHSISNGHTPIQQNRSTPKQCKSDGSKPTSTLPGEDDPIPQSVPSRSLSLDSSIPGLVNHSTAGYASETDTRSLAGQNAISPDTNTRVDADSPKETVSDTIAMSQDMAAMFKRASNLIRESITVEGCVFLDASGATIEDSAFDPDTEEEGSSGSSSSNRRSPSEGDKSTWNIVQGEGDRRHKPSFSQDGSISRGSMCDVLGYSVKYDVQPGDKQATPKFQIPKDTLRRLLKRYPNGSILNFEPNGSFSSSEEEPVTVLGNDSITSEDNPKPRSQESRQSYKKVDSQIIMDTFPGIRRLAFFPLWDTSTNTWFCGALAWTNDPLRVLDADDDMAYLAAFGNSIMAEKARLDASMADRMKSNFLSTVSHELRSPLHGILASAELLKDMSESAAQLDVVSMINVCGRTLLDTITHVLDFTELNRLRKSKPSDKKKRGDRDSLKTKRHSTFNLLKQSADLDLSILVEEVVDSTLVGHDYGQSNSVVMLNAQSHSPSFEARSSSRSREGSAPAHDSVKVVVDIDWQLSWVFSLQPGAWRRIVMNLFGNALKYTKTGHVCVSLKSMANISKQDSRSLVVLTVSDTGKGISKEFLKHHIFKPFWQEDSLATGTGLGLSIVQQIVRDLGGHIEIKSKEGSGTKVTVQIPFAVPALTPAKPSTVDNALQLTVRQKMKGLKVHIILSASSPESGKESESEISKTDSASDLSLRDSLRKTLKDWFEVDIVESSSIGSIDADVHLLLMGEGSRREAHNSDHSFFGTPEVIQLAEANKLMILYTAPGSLSKRTAELHKAAPVIQQPFGPHKLSHAFDDFLKRRAAPAHPSVSQPDLISAVYPLRNSSPTMSVVLDHSCSHTETTISDVNLKSRRDSLSSTHTTVTVTPLPPSVSSPSFKVLLVEDNEINLKLLIMYMRKLNKAYQTAVNGLEAVQKFKEDPHSLRFILMDITMPIMDGLAATREIRRHEQELGLPPATIVALTGASSVNAREKAIVSGVDQFFTKPVPLSVVRSVVSEWKQQSIEDHRQRRL